MKIVHCCLSNFYIDDFAYQENELVAHHVADGHQVLVIASTESLDKAGRPTYLPAGEYFGSDGARVVRLPYRRWLPHIVMKKLRIHTGVLTQLNTFRPDVIMFHGTCGWELRTAVAYKKVNPDVELYVDSHEDFNNSARTWASKWLLHYCYYRLILRSSLAWIEKVLCVNIAAMRFMSEFYGVPEVITEFYPLGGRVVGDDEYEHKRTLVRERYAVGANEVLFVQSGKIDRAKMLHVSLAAFSTLQDTRFKFIVAGHLQSDVAADSEPRMAQDSRIRFVGWLTPDDLRDLLCAADVYLQPGSQSATMQMSLCCRCAVIIDDVASHEPFVEGNGWLVGKQLTLEDAIRDAANPHTDRATMSQRSHAIARRLLDYKTLAARLYR